MDKNSPKIHKKIINFMRHHQWKLILVVLVISFALGYIGFNKYTRALGSDHSVTDIIYLTLQLATLESGSVSGPVSWELDLARYLVPFVTAYSAVLGAALIFRKQLDLLRLKFRQNHTIICGLGEKGWRLASQLQGEGKKVVVIEKDSANPYIALCREMGMIVLERDAQQPDNLSLASVEKAHHLIAVCGDDSTNAQIATAARELSRHRKSGVLHCAIHITDPQLSELLRELEFGFQTFPSFRLEIFNIFERAARFLVSNYTNLGDPGQQQLDPPNLLVVGYSPLTESLVHHLAWTWHENRQPGEAPLKLTLVGRGVQNCIAGLAAKYPQFPTARQLTLLDLDLDDPAFLTGEFLFDGSGACDFQSIFVCLKDTSAGLGAALRLRGCMDCSRPPIILYMAEEDGLARLLIDDQESIAPVHNIIPFKLIERTCQPDLIINGTHELIARAMHEDYLRQRLSEGLQMGQKRSMTHWEDLPEDLRESNRRQVDHTRVKLHQVGCGIKPIQDWDASDFLFSPAEIEVMAEMEHEHWMEERLKSGWRYAPGGEDPQNKTHPDLVPWKDLSENAREKDRQPHYSLPKMLARAGFQIFRWRKG